MIAAAALGSPLAAVAQTTTQAPAATGEAAGAKHTVSAADTRFVKTASEGGLAEVQLSQLALKQSQNDDVRNFAQKMVDDHTKANDQLKEIASKDNLEIPASLDPKHQARIDKMSKLSGPEFDKAYIKDQLKDHEQDVSEFQKEAQNGTDPNVKQFAASTLPTLQEHLNMVKQLKNNETASK